METGTIQIGELRGTAYPVPKMKAAMRALHGLGTTIPLEDALRDAEAIETLAGFIERAIAESTNDGALDYREVAARVIRTMRAGGQP